MNCKTTLDELEIEFVKWAISLALKQPSHTPDGLGPNAGQPISQPWSKGRICDLYNRVNRKLSAGEPC